MPQAQVRAPVAPTPALPENGAERRPAGLGPEKRIGQGIRGRSLSAAESRLGLILILPSLLLIGALTIYPLLSVVWLSLTSKSALSPVAEFIGLRNFATLMGDREFWRAFATGVVWTVGSVGLQLVSGVGVARLLHREFRGRALARGLILFPYLVPTIVGALTWIWLFDSMYGIVNHVLMTLGVVREPVLWFSSGPMAMLSVILLNTWKFFPFVVICVLAKLQTIPAELYEAARIDGAGAWREFWLITLPQLRSVILLIVLLRAFWTYNNFDVIYLTTGGGPYGATQNLPILTYLRAFQGLQMGLASAMAVMGFLSLLVFAWVFSLVKGRVDR